jgi:sugar phosphate permease
MAAMLDSVPRRPEPEPERVPTRPNRLLMYVLISLHGMPNWMVRGGIFSWMPFVVKDMALTEAQRAMLMAAWFPGYAFAQVPSAALIMKIGAKKVMGMNMLGTCGAYLALPFVASLGRTTAQKVRLMAACLGFAGFCQAPLVAGQKTFQRNWLPKVGSPSRPIHHKLVSLGELFGQGILASTLTPWIASNFGWRAVNVAMGGGGLLCAAVWFAFAKEAPVHWKLPGAPTSAPKENPATAKASASSVPASPAAATAARQTDWRLFRHPAVLAVLWWARRVPSSA